MSRFGLIGAATLFLWAWTSACASGGSGPVCDLSGMDWRHLRAATPLRAHVRLVSGGRDLSLDVIAQMNGTELVIVGLTPYGARVFVAREESGELRVEGGADRRTEIETRKVLDSLLRASAGGVNESGDEKEALSIRYSSTKRGPVLEIRHPRCGYEASVAGVSGSFFVPQHVSPQGVEP